MKRNFFTWLSILSITFLSGCIESASSPPAFSAKTVENALTFWQENGVRDYEFSWTWNGATPNCSVNVHDSHRSGVSDVNLEYDGSYAESSEADRIAEMDTVEEIFQKILETYGANQEKIKTGNIYHADYHLKCNGQYGYPEEFFDTVFGTREDFENKPPMGGSRSTFEFQMEDFSVIRN